MPAGRLAAIDDAGRFGGRFGLCPAIDPFFSDPIYQPFSGAPRNGGRNQNWGLSWPIHPLSVVFAERVKTLQSARKQLMRVGLMAGVPDHLVGRYRIRGVERNGQFDDANNRAGRARGF